MKKYSVIIFSILMILVFPQFVNASENKLEITVPSVKQERIAPGRDFYIMGNLNLPVNEGDELEINLYPNFSQSLNKFIMPYLLVVQFSLILSA